jgi:hypothetical protein
MKKVLLFGVLWALVSATLVFGEDSYTVEGVTGPVYRLGAAGQWITVFPGDILNPATIIRIGLDAALVVKGEDTEQILRSARQGALESFLAAGSLGAEGRVSVGGRAVDSHLFPGGPGSSPSDPPPPWAPPRTPIQDRELDWAD